MQPSLALRRLPKKIRRMIAALGNSILGIGYTLLLPAAIIAAFLLIIWLATVIGNLLKMF